LLDLQDDPKQQQPLSLSSPILELTQDFLTNPDTMGQVSQCYVDQAAYFDGRSAGNGLKKDFAISFFKEFSNIEQTLRALDEYRYD